MDRSARVRAAARECGFDAAGVCDLRPIERVALQAWLARGYGGNMTYLNRQAAKRREPQRIVPQAKRAVVVVKNYFSPAPTPSTTSSRSTTCTESATPGHAARVARYAWGEDYHRVVGDQLRRLAGVLIELGSSPEATRCYVDAGPVPERELAERAGLGWIGKNTMLIRPDLGSFTFLGTVFTDLDLEVDAPFTTDHCGTCRLCLDACPTAAFVEPRLLDARRCISYLTIEHRRPFTEEQGRMIGEWVFGCDVCQDVCPWNLRFAAPTTEPRFAPRAEIAAPDVDRLSGIGDEEFARRFADTALERVGAAGLRRNARQVRENGPVPPKAD